MTSVGNKPGVNFCIGTAHQYGAWVGRGSALAYEITAGTNNVSGTTNTSSYGNAVGGSATATASATVEASVGIGIASASASATVAVAATVSYNKSWGKDYKKIFSQGTTHGRKFICNRKNISHSYVWVWTIFGSFLDSDFETEGVPGLYCVYTTNKGMKPKCMPGYCKDWWNGCQDCYGKPKKWLDPGSQAFTETLCAENENDNCACNGQVYFGAKFASGKPGSGAHTTLSQLKALGYIRKAVSGSIKCDTSNFGEPRPGYYKYCICESTTQA